MLGVRLDEETERSLDSVARDTKRSKSQIAREAIRDYVLRHDKVAQARVEQAKAEWNAICERERADPALLSVLDGLATDLTRDL